MISNKTIVNIIYSLFFLTLLTPFIVSNSLYFPFVVGKTFFFRTLVSFILILWVILIFRDRKYLPSRNYFNLTFSLLAISLLVSAVFGESFRQSIFGNFERMNGWINTLTLLSFFLVLSSVVKAKEFWNKFFFTQIVTSLILLLIGIGELIEKGIDFRISGPLGNPSYLSVLFLFSVFFAIYLLFENYSTKIKLFLGLTILLNSLGIFFTGTRGVMLGILVSFFFMTIIFSIKYWKLRKIKYIAIFSVSLFVILVTSIFTFRDSSFIKENDTLSRISEINTLDQGTSQTRLILWRIALDGIKERPVLGWGQENYIHVFEKNYDPRIDVERKFFDYPHNNLLGILVDGGFTALLLYLSLFAFAIFYLFKKQDISMNQKIVLSSLFIAYFIQNLFIFDNTSSSVLIFSIFAFCIPASGIVKKVNIQKEVLFFVLFLIALFILFYGSILPFKASAGLRNADFIFEKIQSNNFVLDSSQTLSAMEDSLDKIFFLNQTDKIDSIKRVSAFFLQNKEVAFGSEDIKNNYYNIANNFSKKIYQEIEKNPDFGLLYYSAGMFNVGIGNLEEAERLQEKSIELSPNNIIYMIPLAETKKMLGKIDEYLYLKELIYLLDKDNQDNWFSYAIIIGQYNDKKFEELLFLKSREKNSLPSILRVLDFFIENNPDNIKINLNKVILLAKIGLFKESLSSLDEVEEKFPEIIPQTKTWRFYLEQGELPK